VTSGNTLAITSAGRLVTFDREDPALDTAIAVTGLQASESILGIDVRAGGSGALYALGSTGRVYTVNTNTGVATLAATLTADSSDSTDAFTALGGTEFGVDFDPVSDRLRVVSDTGQNLRVNVDSGATITDAPLTTGGNPRSGVNGAAYTNAFGAACRTALYYIDANTDELLTTADPAGGALTSVGPLGVDTSAVSDFEIATAADGSNTGYAVLVVAGMPTSYQINLTNGAAATAGPVTRLDTNELVRDTAIAPPATAPTQEPGDVFALTEMNKLVSFNSALPQKVCTSAAFTGQQSGENINSIDVRPADQQLYAFGSSGRLYIVDKATAALTLKSTLIPMLGDSAPYAGLTGSVFGFDFNPGNDLVRVVDNAGANFRVLPEDGLVQTDANLNPLGAVVSEAAYGNSFAGAGTASYYVIDSASDSLQVVGQPSGNAINGDLEPVGTLRAGGDVQMMAGFDILGTDNRGLAALNLMGSSSSDLFSINLSSGAATRIETIGGGERVRGLAFARLPMAVVYGLTSDNHLVSFRATSPGTFDSDVTVTGLSGTEGIIGIDFRPSSGALYAVTDGGHVYKLDPATGAVSAAVTLSANPLDATAPFAGFSGTVFGVDFGSVDNVLRIQSNTGQNLRVNVDDGTVITDGNLNPGAPQVVGTAFTNSYAGATTSLHYALDLGTNTLVRQTSISGALTTVGPLTVLPPATPTTFQLEGEFDITGGQNGLPVAALLPVGATQSSLYRVNLANGSLTLLGAIGTSSTTVIRDIAVRLQ